MIMSSTTSYILAGKRTLLRIGIITIATLIGLSPLCADAEDTNKELILESLKHLFGELSDKGELRERKDIEIRVEKRLRKQEVLIKGLGFESIGQLGSTSLDIDDPFAIYEVHLDDLRTYKREKEPWDLLKSTQGKVYPILDKEKAKRAISSATTIENPIEKPNEPKNKRIKQWGTTEHILLARARAELKDELTKKSVSADTSRFIAVSVPAVGRYFLGITNVQGAAGKLELQELKVLVNRPGNLRKGDLLPAKQVFEELSTAANSGRYDFTSREFPSGEPIPVKP